MRKVASLAKKPVMLTVTLINIISPPNFKFLLLASHSLKFLRLN